MRAGKYKHIPKDNEQERCFDLCRHTMSLNFPETPLKVMSFSLFFQVHYEQALSATFYSVGVRRRPDSGGLETY